MCTSTMTHCAPPLPLHISLIPLILAGSPLFISFSNVSTCLLLPKQDVIRSPADMHHVSDASRLENTPSSAWTQTCPCNRLRGLLAPLITLEHQIPLQSRADTPGRVCYMTVILVRVGPIAHRLHATTYCAQCNKIRRSPGPVRRILLGVCSIVRGIVDVVGNSKEPIFIKRPADSDSRAK